MAGDGDRLLADPLHEIAVGGQHVGAMVDDVAELGGEHPLGQRHADRHAETLAQRAGGRLDADRMPVFGMARRLRAELPEALEIVDRQPVGAADARQIQQRIEQHRAVTGRQHEPVAVGPLRVGGVEFQNVAKQHGRDIGGAHRQSGMAAVGLFDRVHRQRAKDVGHRVMGHDRRHSTPQGPRRRKAALLSATG